MKLLIILFAAWLVISAFDSFTPSLKSAYAATPYDRCMEAYQGTTNASQCSLLK